MEENIKLKGQLRFYMQWPMILTILLVAMNIWIYRLDNEAGAVMTIFVMAYVIVALYLYFVSKRYVLADMVEFAIQYGIVQNTLLAELSTPYVIMTGDGKIIWGNAEFEAVLGGSVSKSSYLSKYIPELHRGVFPKYDGEVVSMELSYKDRDYRAEIRCVSVEGFSDTEQLLELPKENEHFIALHLCDVTEQNRLIRENEEQRMVAGLIYIDNFDEVMDSVEEVRQSLLVALIDRKINQYISGLNGIVKKLEKDKYFIVIKQKNYTKMQENMFSLLEDVKTVKIGNQIPVTLSIGLGLGTDTYTAGYNYARVAIDLALARGGDQAVVKTPEGMQYYGGKREQMAKNTRVKARVKAEALREFMVTKERVLVMGHKMADVDSFGAAIGIYKAATAMEKKVNIVLNDITMTVRPFYEMFKDDSVYPDDLFVKSHEAEQLVDDNTMVVVVDTNKPRMTECERLLKLAKTIVVLDHHRQSDEVIENALLSYIEPYASSTCEMVAEVLQYFADDLRLNTDEANSLYAGIIIDTNNFMTRAGVRTFEAAAYLRRAGADITHVRKLLRDDLASYRAKAAIITGAEVYKNVFAIATADELDVPSPTIIGAQVANELLNIDEIKASFVLTTYNDKIYVSARSIDEINVQRIMEALGGGGHITVAGVQFEHTDMKEAVRALKSVIDIVVKKGEV